MNTVYIIIRTIKGSNYSTILRTYQQNEKQKAKAELKLLRKGDIIYDYKLKEYQKVKKSGGNIMKNEIEITVKIIKNSDEWKKHWTPKFGEDYFYIDSSGEISDSIHKTGFHNAEKREECYNMFPTRELAEKAVNLSKISRLALLWQYANDCVHTPDWSSTTKNNFHFSLDIASDKIGVDRVYLFKRDIYFKTQEQAQAFIDMYDKEIKKIMGVI